MRCIRVLKYVAVCCLYAGCAKWQQILYWTMMKSIVFILLTGAAAFSPISQTVRKSSQLRESFGLGIGEDSYENQPKLLRGEAEYKQFINKYAENNMLNRKVS
jgi:hypothetical protein